MNKNQRLSIVSVFVLSIASLSACAVENTTMPSTNTFTAAPPVKQATTTNYVVKVIESGAVSFSKVRVIQRKAGYAVTGKTKLKTSQRRVLKMPGYIMVTLTATDGSELESIKAKFHRKFGASKAGHFDAMLKTTPPAGSQITVEHINN